MDVYTHEKIRSDIKNKDSTLTVVLYNVSYTVIAVLHSDATVYKILLHRDGCYCATTDINWVILVINQIKVIVVGLLVSLSHFFQNLQNYIIYL
jgi:hypothetical protein